MNDPPTAVGGIHQPLPWFGFLPFESLLSFLKSICQRENLEVLAKLA
jgi:hypothetical protein